MVTMCVYERVGKAARKLCLLKFFQFFDSCSWYCQSQGAFMFSRFVFVFVPFAREMCVPVCVLLCYRGDCIHNNSARMHDMFLVYV